VIQLTGVFLKLLPLESAIRTVLMVGIIVIAGGIMSTVMQLTGVFLKLLPLESVILLVLMEMLIAFVVLIMFIVMQIIFASPH